MHVVVIVGSSNSQQFISFCIDGRTCDDARSGKTLQTVARSCCGGIVQSNAAVRLSGEAGKNGVRIKTFINIDGITPGARIARCCPRPASVGVVVSFHRNDGHPTDQFYQIVRHSLVSRHGFREHHAVVGGQLIVIDFDGRGTVVQSQIELGRQCVVNGVLVGSIASFFQTVINGLTTVVAFLVNESYSLFGCVRSAEA